MSNVEIEARFVDGSLRSIHEKGESCRLAVESLIGDDFGAPPRSLNFTVATASGRTVKLIVPYSQDDPAIVSVDGVNI